MSAAKSTVPISIARAVYDGRERLGHFQQSDDSTFIAFDRRGRQIGRFDTAIEAANAISEKAGAAS
jgi:hypothetical protein